MTGRVTIDADLNFVQGLIHHGGADLKKCYQCSTCTVACPLTPDEAPFPRKEMLWAQWGMKDKLVRDMDLWLCHNCNDCTDLCQGAQNQGKSCLPLGIRQLNTIHILHQFPVRQEL